MNFRSENVNPLPDLVELRTKIEAKTMGEPGHQLLVELRVHPYEFSEPFGTFEVGISEAVLSVDFAGLEIVPKSKLGNPVADYYSAQQVQYERTATTLSERGKSTSVSGGVGISPTGGDGSARVSRESSEKAERSVSERVSRTDTLEHRNLKAIGDNNWKLSAGPNGLLDAVYLDYDPLCEVTPMANRNRVGVETALVVRQRNIQPRMIESRFTLTNNQKKIWKILVAKSLHETASGGEFDGNFVFATSQSFDEG